MRWITTTAGQRAVTMEDGASTPIIVRDFNLYAVRSARARAAASGHSQQHCDWSEELPNGNQMTLKVDDNVITAGSVFKDDVRSSLPYVEIVTLADYRYEGVLIDEERILGLKVRPGIIVRAVYVVKFSFSYRLAKKTSLGFRHLTFISWASLPTNVTITVVRLWSMEFVSLRSCGPCIIIGFRVLVSCFGILLHFTSTMYVRCIDLLSNFLYYNTHFPSYE